MSSEKEVIIDHLHDHMNCIINQGYDPQTILGVFLYGSQNYGLTDYRSNKINSIVVILPSFEDVCLNAPPVSKEYSYGVSRERIRVKDLRLYRQQLLKQNINFLETLFTEYYVLNPEYEELFKQYLVANNEDIAHLNTHAASSGMGQQIMSLLNQSPIDSRTLYEANRLFFCLRQYVLGRPFLECIQPNKTDKEFLIEIKQRRSRLIKDPEALDKNVQNLKYQTQNLLNSDSIFNEVTDKKTQAALDNSIVEIMKASFSQTPTQESGITATQFLDQLTGSERRAYDTIAFESHGHGYVVISRLMDKYGIGRSTYYRTFTKIKTLGVGITNSCGNKGVYVEIIHPQLKHLAETMKEIKKINNE